jgi:pimeloyl-ACP methyl ester carboxylesterase
MASDGVELAYQVVGHGPVDLLWSFSQLGDVETIWEYPPIRAFLEELSVTSRLIVHDRRGLGRSRGEPGDLDTDVADLLAVLDAVGAKRPYLAGAVIGGAVYASFAATHPGRAAGVIWHGAFAQAHATPGYPWGDTSEGLEGYTREITDSWGTEPFAAEFVAGGAPSRAGDAEAARFFARWMQRTASAQTAAAYNRSWDGADLHPRLAALRVPTLIITRGGGGPAESAYVASLIPGSELVELEGEDFMPFFESAPVITAIRAFIGQTWSD